MIYEYSAKYALTKLSDKSFAIYSNDLGNIHQVLSAFCCSECRDKSGNDFFKLLCSDCGCEFMFEENVKITEET